MLKRWIKIFVFVFVIVSMKEFLYSTDSVNSTMTITVACDSFEPPDATYSTFTIIVAFNYPPTVSIISPTGTFTTEKGFTLNPRPKVWFYATDKNGDQLGDWAFIIADDSNFSVNVSTYQFSVSGSGWSPNSSPVSQGTTFYYTPQVNFSKTYHWIKAMVKDYGVLGGGGEDRTVWGTSPAIKIYINPFTWTDNIVAGQTIIRKVHFDELRYVIDGVRQFRNLAPCTWTDTITAGQTLIRKVHMDELRGCLDDALYVIGESTGSAKWSDYNISAGSTMIRAVHINELRTEAAKP
jgi:hypothetical protein